MIVFKLSMPHKASWNGRWSGEERCYARIKDERLVPKELWDKDFFYRWDDGWEACVSVQRVPAREAHRINKQSVGFCGYDWMITSLIENGYIERRQRNDNAQNQTS